MRRLRAGLVAGTVIVGSLLPVPSADAAYPGANGKIVFSSNRDFQGAFDLWRMDADGGNPSKITESPFLDAEATWSPGGKRIAFTRYVSSAYRGDIWVINADGSGLHQITTEASDDYAPSWSPDGARIVFSSDRDGDYEIFTMKLDGTDVRQVTHNAVLDIEPAWSPDGTKIAFVTNREGPFVVYTMAPDGTTATHAPKPPTNFIPRYVNWSPDASQIVFDTVEDCGAWLIDLQAWTVNPILGSSCFTTFERPAFSPAGDFIIFDTNHNDNRYFEIQIQAWPAGSLTTLTASTGDANADPDWQPIPAFPLVDARFSTFNADIQWVYNVGITKGCDIERYCPSDTVSRGQMAAFLARAMDLPAASADYFTDDETSIYEADINRLAEAGVTKGCTATTFCPNATITREQMAAFLDRALDLPSTVADYFTDDEASLFEASINRVAAANITKGCTATTFCPRLTVSRGQMAAFLHRGFG